jgi:hypothetical protein
MMLLFFPIKSLRHLGLYYQEIKAYEIRSNDKSRRLK